MDITSSEPPSENLINNVLIDDIFRFIFARYFDERRLLQLRSVCSKWKQIIEQLFAAKRTICLSESSDCFQSRQINLATAPQFEADFQLDNIKHLPFSSAQFLAGLLTSAEKFAFNYSNEYSSIDVSPFFQTMTTLTTVILDRLPYSHLMHQKILWSLNGLLRLVYLHLCNMHEIQIPHDMTVFAQLEVFKLDHYNSKNFSSLANQLGPPLRRLELFKTSFNTDYCTQKQFPALQILKLQEILLEDTDENESKLVPHISKNLPLLESLYLRIAENYTFIAAMTMLSQMKHLKQLSLLLASCDDLWAIPANLPSFPALKLLDLQFYTWNPSVETALLDVIAIMCPYLTHFTIYDARLHSANIAKIKNCVNLKAVITICPEYNEDRQRFESVKVVHKLRD